MAAIMQAESGCNPDAINYDSNGTTDAGLLQINSVHCPQLLSLQARFDPSANVKAAYAIYLGSGLNAWSTYTSGKYQEYL